MGVGDINSYTLLFGTTKMTHVSQIEWLDTEYFVVSDAGHTSEASVCNGGTVIDNGYLCLGKINDTNSTCIDYVALPQGSKPEGIAIEAIDSSPSCTNGADWVVYVIDYCQSDLYVYTVDLATESFTYETVISLDDDKNNASSSIGGYCNPSNIEARFHSSANNLFALCQTRDSVMRIHVTGIGYDQCSPGWITGDDELLLEKHSTGTFNCSLYGTTTECDYTKQDCMPHDISIPYYMWPNYLFITLTGSGDIVAVKDDFSAQRLLYHQTSTDNVPWGPLEIEVIPSCSPTDPNCEYPP